MAENNYVMISLGAEDSLYVRFPYSAKNVSRIRSLSGARYLRNRSAWRAPLSEETLLRLKELFAGDNVFVADDVRDFFKETDKKEQEVIEWKNQPLETLQFPADLSFHTEPRDHQKRALAYCLNKPAWGLWMEMGTGKTKVMLDLMGYAAQKKMQRPFLIIVPSQVVGRTWLNEACKHRPELSMRLLVGSVANKIEQFKAYLGTTDAFVVNYDSAWRMHAELLRRRYGIVILDESHYIKNKKAARSKFIIKLGAQASRRYCLTGTPMPNNPLEIFNQVRFLDPSIFGYSERAFQDAHTVQSGFYVLGYKNLESLSRKLSTISYRVTKQECLDLPDKIYQSYEVDMASEQKRVYKELSKTLVSELEGQTLQVSTALAKLVKLRQVASGFIYGDNETAHEFTPNPKVEVMRDLFEEGGLRNSKVIVWYAFKQERKILQSAFQKMDIETTFIDGEVPQDKRMDRIDQFKAVGGPGVLLAHLKTGIGFTVTECSNMIYFSNDWGADVRQQTEDRIHRIGQTNKCLYIDVLSRGSIDVEIRKLLQEKKKLSDAITMNDIKKLMGDVYGHTG